MRPTVHTAHSCVWQVTRSEASQQRQTETPPLRIRTHSVVTRANLTALPCNQRLTLVPISAQLELTLPLSAQRKLTVSPI